MKKTYFKFLNALVICSFLFCLSSCGGDSSSTAKSSTCTSCDGKGIVEKNEGGCTSSCLNRQAALPCSRHVAKTVQIKCADCNGSGKLNK